MVRTHQFRCQSDNSAFEAEIDDQDTIYAPCPRCGRLAPRIVATFTMPLRMGLDPGFPTAWDRWARVRNKHTQHANRLKKEHGDIR